MQFPFLSQHCSENTCLPLNMTFNQRFSSLCLHADLLSGNKTKVIHTDKTSIGDFLHCESTSSTRRIQLTRLKVTRAHTSHCGQQIWLGIFLQSQLYFITHQAQNHVKSISLIAQLSRANQDLRFPSCPKHNADQ